MSTMQVEVYEAFRSLDVSDDKALKAAAALGKRGDELAALRTDMKAEFAAVRAEMGKGFAKVDIAVAALRGEQAIVRWMLGFMLATQVAILFKVFPR